MKKRMVYFSNEFLERLKKQRQKGGEVKQEWRNEKLGGIKGNFKSVFYTWGMPVK